MPFVHSDGAVVFYKGPKGPSSSVKAKEDIEFLLLQYKRNGREWWDYPKGHREKGESGTETMLREIKEETGLTDVEIVSGFKTWIKFFFKEGGPPNGEARPPASSKLQRGEKGGKTVAKIVDFYLVEAKTKEVRLSFEHAGFVWLPYEQALEKLTYKNAKGVLQKAYAFLNQEARIKN